MKKLLLCLFLAALTFGVYSPALQNGIVWDDTALLLRDPLIRSPRLIAEGFQHFLFTDATASDFYRPIQRLLYTLEYAAYGVRPFGYHVTSIACHLAAAIALFFFAQELLRVFGVAEPRRRWAAAIASMIWAIHPLHNAAVAYISGRADPLAAAFGFSALYAALVSFRVGAGRHWVLTAASGVLLLLSSLSKESGLIFPAAAIVMFLALRHWRAAGRMAVVALLVMATYASLRLPAEHIAPERVKPPAPLLVRPIIVARAVAEYSYLALLPINLHMERDVETYPNGFGNESLKNSAWRELETLAGVVLIGAFCVWLLRARKKDGPVFTLLLLTVLTYLPISGLVSLNATIAEHWFYLPSAFLFLAVTFSVMQWAESWHLKSLIRLGVSALATIWILFLAGRCFIRTTDWKDPRTFLERTIANGGDSARMLINLAGVEMNEGDFPKARAHLDQALQKEPDQPLAVLNSGALAIKEGDFVSARQSLLRATEMPIVGAQAHELLAVLSNRETGKVDVMRLRLASHTGAPDWLIEKRYIKVLHETGATDAAIAETKHCLQTQWYRAESWELLGELLEQAGRQAEAATAFAQANAYDVRLAARPRVL